MNVTVAGKSVNFFVAERDGYFAACGLADSSGIEVSGRGVDFDRISLDYVSSLDEYVNNLRSLMP